MSLVSPTWLDEERDPMVLFNEWRHEAVAAPGAPSLPDAMCLSTVDGDGSPHSRFVDLKAVHDHGFVFCTSHVSPKSGHIEANPRVALTIREPVPDAQLRRRPLFGPGTVRISAIPSNFGPVRASDGAFPTARGSASRSITCRMPTSGIAIRARRLSV